MTACRLPDSLGMISPNVRHRILVKRSEAWASLGMWEDALKDADEAIKADPRNPWGYKRRHAALRSLQRYDEAIDALSCMLGLIQEASPDAHFCRKKYISPSQSVAAIDSVVRSVSKILPFVLIDVKNGRLCDGSERMHAFKSEPQFKELVSSLTEKLDNERIQRVVEEYFRYVALSHVWEGKEPLLQDVKRANTIWKLDSSPLNEKLHKFCEVVRADGYRWAWSDSCCIDKTDNAVLSQSLTLMYKWYEASTATFVFLRDVDVLSTLVGLKDSIWMTRAWTSQELLAPKVIRFYDRNWKPYFNDTRSNHKQSPEIMQELADALQLSRKTIITFNPDDLGIREKLRLASTRSATVEEDIAYSLIGIFKSDIRPHYGEGDAALGHLLEEIVARSGEVSVLAWTGKPSSYNSCLPASLAAYSQTLFTLRTIEGAKMDESIAALKTLVPEEEVIPFYAKVTHLHPARFASRRLYLPSIVFVVNRLELQSLGNSHEYHYRALVSGIGNVEFQASEELTHWQWEPRRFILVHPWIRDLQGPFDGSTWGNTADDDDGHNSHTECGVGSSIALALCIVPTVTMDDYTRALRIVVRLQQPFQALLLQQESTGDFKRIATEHAIIVPGIEPEIDLARDVRIEVVEIL